MGGGNFQFVYFQMCAFEWGILVFKTVKHVLLVSKVHMRLFSLILTVCVGMEPHAKETFSNEICETASRAF